MTEKKKNIVATAAKNTVESKTKMSENIEETANNTPVSTKQPQNRLPESIDEILNTISPEKLKMAEKFGLPLEPLIQYLRVQETKLNYVIEHTPDAEQIKSSVSEAMQNVIKQSTTNINPQQGGGGLAGLLPMIAQMGLGGGNSDSELTKQLMSMQLARMKTDMAFTDAIKNALVSRLTAKAVEDVTKL